MTSIIVKENKITHVSDIQGTSSNQALNWLLFEKPELLVLSCPPIYLDGYFKKKVCKVIKLKI